MSIERLIRREQYESANRGPAGIAGETGNQGGSRYPKGATLASTAKAAVPPPKSRHGEHIHARWRG
jgi:hypothetical protein